MCLCNPLRNLKFWGSTLCVLSIFTACSDEDLIGNSSSSNIKFEVSVSQDSKKSTRSSASDYKSVNKSLTLQGGRSPLYLHPKTLRGIVTGTPENATRSGLISNETLQNFGVFASLKADESTSISGLHPDYMTNVEVKRADNWSLADDYLWPGKGVLHINSYAPFCDSPSSEGIVKLPVASDTGELSLSYKTPAAVADQIDLLYSNPVNANSSPCDLTFNHALSAIRFATGAEMVPCTIKQISISGVASTGTLNLETGVWNDVSNVSSYSVDSLISLSAMPGSKYVAPDTFITSGDQTFILIPQTLGADAMISVTLVIDGKEQTLNTSLENVTWNSGTTTIYRLSVNPKSDGYILEVTDNQGTPISSMESSYTGSDLNFRITSMFGQAGDTVSQTNVAWKAEFIDDDGNVITKPQWIADWVMSGSGSVSLTGKTQMQVPTFEAISAESAALRNAGNINQSSGCIPYNLSNSSGQSTVQNTANCYMIHAPGNYSIPLVYGNAIKDGSANTSAYTASTRSTVHILKNFINHLGNAITDPYIYNNSNCVPSDAVVIWEDRLNTVSNVKLSEDKRNILFDVSPDFICQGNAIVAVRDSNGIVLWSWHLWLTPFLPDSDPISITYNGTEHKIMYQNLGQVSQGDRINFKSQSVKVRYTQIPDDDSEPLSLVLTITQSGKLIEPEASYCYYQWGRKDPMISSTSVWYNADFQEMTEIMTKGFLSDSTSGLSILADYIRTPGYFWTSSHTQEVFTYYNLWNMNNSNTTEVKTVYDPSPVGYRVARNSIVALLNQTISSATDGAYGTGVNITNPSGGSPIFFAACGYRSSVNGLVQGMTSEDKFGTVWTSRSTSTIEAFALSISTNHTIAQMVNDARPMGFGVRSSKEL